MERKMNKLILLILLSFLVFSVYSQDENTKSPPPDILLIPILETVFSNNIQWNPYWPSGIPPDGFSINKAEKQPEVIELYNDTDKFVVRRDEQGRLVQFPFFLLDGYAQIQAVYNLTGTLKSLEITKYNSASSQEDDSPDKVSESTETKISIAFPDDFMPYSEFSPGGIFPPLAVTADETAFIVFIFESPLFLTETWYDVEGNLSLFSKASVFTDKGFWRIRSLQIHSDEGVSFLEYFHDSYGNITEIRSEDSAVSALYRDNRPSYRKDSELQYEYQWDTQGILTIVKATGADDSYVEYRYGYENDSIGNWISRQETAFILQFELLASNLSYSRGIWNRRIEY
jgi:hypothetical protein